MSADPRLLVVDDEPDLRTLYEMTLLREGFTLDSAGTVEDALERLSARRYDAVITDMRLPDGSGLDILRWLEQQGAASARWSSPPTVRRRTPSRRSRPAPTTT